MSLDRPSGGAIAVSVVMSARNVAASIVDALDALAPQLTDMRAELVCVDDASIDDTARLMVAWAARHPGVQCTVVRAHRRRGINGSRNAGIAFSRGSFLAFCDGDDEVHPGWLRHLTDRHHPGAMVTGQVFDPSSGLVFPPKRFYGVSLPLVFGGCFGVERALLEAVGGFDERIRRGGTESELVLAAQLDHGATVVSADEAVVTYRLPLTRRARQRRILQQQRGHAYIARRLAARRDGTITTFVVARRARGALGHLFMVVTGPAAARRDRWDRAVTELVAIAWLVRFALYLPKPRRADPAVRNAYTVVAAPPEAGSAVSKNRSDPSP